MLYWMLLWVLACVAERNATIARQNSVQPSDEVFGLLLPVIGVVRGALAGGAGTVWDAITATQPLYEGTVVPRSFILATEGADVWVAPNASEHLAEWALGNLGRGVSPELVNIGTQTQLTSLQAAVGEATSNGITYGTMQNVGGWELMFSPARQAGQLPALIHALPQY